MSRINRSKMKIADSIKKLMLENPLEKITVGDIVEEAGIGRNTFYYHFQDKFDLVNWIFRMETTDYFDHNVTRADWAASVEGLQRYLMENREFYCNALSYTGQNSLAEFLFRKISTMVSERISESTDPELSGLSEEEASFAAHFIASAATGLILNWAREGMKEGPGAYETCMHRLCDSSLLNAFLKAPADPSANRTAKADALPETRKEANRAKRKSK